MNHFNALVIANYGNAVEIKDQNTQKIYQCTFQKSLKTPVCGDYVSYQTINEHQAKIIQIAPRKSLIYRLKFNKKKPIAANVTDLLITLAIEPAPDFLLLDQYLVFARLNHLSATILLNKCDLSPTPPKPLQNTLSYYQAMGYSVEYISSKLEQLPNTLLKTQTKMCCIFVGQSGVGKSSIIKKLTQDSSIATKQLNHTQGNHCTAYTKIYNYRPNIEIIDSPGIRELTVNIDSLEALKEGFSDINQRSRHCQFNNCRHLKELQCAVKNAIKNQQIHPHRLSHYHQLIELYNLKH